MLYNFQEARDDIRALQGQLAVPLRKFERARSGTQSIPDSTGTAINFNSLINNELSNYLSWSASGVTCTKPLRVTIHAWVQFATSSSGNFRALTLARNGSGVAAQTTHPSGSFPDRCALSWVLDLEAGDTIAFNVFQNSGGALNITAGGFQFTAVGVDA